jgi:hypothetical protein
MRSQQAELMASQQLRKSYSVGYMKGYEAEALTYTKDHVASPMKAISVAVHLDDLAPISASGIIKNQFHGGFIQSSGMNHTGLRAAHEAIAYGTHPLALPDRRPIYGNLHPLGVQHMYANGTSQYGSVQLVMKPEVHARTTFSVADSLGHVRNAQPLNGPITSGQPSTSIKTTKRGPSSRISEIKDGKSHEYAESQIHGGIKLSDVSYIAYSATDKKGVVPTRVKQFAKNNGLEIVVIPNDAPSPWGIVDIGGPVVKKAFDAIIARIDEAVEKGRKRRFATRTEAAQYAANIRWANNQGGKTPSEEEEMASISAELSQIQLQCATYDESRMTDVATTISEANYDQSPVVGKTENLAVYVGMGVEPVPSKELATLSQRTHAIGERVTGVAERRLTAKGVTPESAKKEQDEIMARGQEKRKEEQQAHFDLRKAMVRHDAQQTPESLAAKKEARAKANKLKAERETLEVEWSQASYESRLMGETRGVMGELVDMGNPTRLNRLKIVGLPHRFKQEMMADIPTIFPSSVIDRAMTQQAPNGLYTLSVSKTMSQFYLGSYARATNSISIASTAGTYLQLRSTAVHEFGHAVDFAHPISHALSMAFVARRIRTGHQDKVTDDITKASFWSRPVKNPNDMVSVREAGNHAGRKSQYEDEFYRPYTGRNYADTLPTGKTTGTSGGGYSKAFPATEVLTTGVEALFGIEKYNYRFDRDLVNHTVGVLLAISDGVIKKSVDAIDKAQSFGGNRSAAGQYAAQVRWGNRGAKTEAPALPSGWTVVQDKTYSDGTKWYELEGPADDGGVLSAAVKTSEAEVNVDLNRFGGTHRNLGVLWATDPEHAALSSPRAEKGKYAIQDIHVHSDERRKGYATLMLQLARAKSFGGKEVVHSTQLTDDGEGFASAVKSEGLEKKKEGAQSFGGDRSAAARYAAEVRWGNRGAKTESPTLPDGWTVIDQITTREGTNHYELQGPRYADEGGTLTATISANSEESYVELNRVGGAKQGSIGQMRTERDEEYNIENGFPKTTHTIQNIGVEPLEQRKGYATLLLRIGRALSYNGLQIQHSPSLTEDGKGFASAVKSEGLEKKKEGAKSFGGNRSEAGRYAARIRWGNRLGNSTQPNDGDPLFDATAQLTPAQESIAAQAEGAVVDPLYAGGKSQTEQQVNALLAAGFVGKGEPPKPPKTKYSEEADTVDIGFVPDYYLLPPHLQTPKIIAEQNAAFEQMLTMTQKYRNGEIDYFTFIMEKSRIGDLAKNAQEIGRENGLEIDFGSWTNTPFMTNRGGMFGNKVGINRKTGRSHDFDTIKPEQMGTTRGRDYFPSRRGLEEREKRILAVHNSQKGGKKEQKQYDKAVDKWMGVKTDVTQVTKKGYNARNARVAQVLGDLNGFHRGSQTVTGSDFDALARSGRFYVVWRGAGKSEIASMSSRHPHIGGGEQGLGTYTTYLKERASGYGKVTPMLIPKSAVKAGRMETGAWGSAYGDDTTYRNRQNLSHGESARIATGDFKVANLSMVIVGPRNHPTNYILDGYGQWVDSALGDLRVSDLE